MYLVQTVFYSKLWNDKFYFRVSGYLFVKVGKLAAFGIGTTVLLLQVSYPECANHSCSRWHFEILFVLFFKENKSWHIRWIISHEVSRLIFSENEKQNNKKQKKPPPLQKKTNNKHRMLPATILLGALKVNTYLWSLLQRGVYKIWCLSNECSVGIVNYQKYRVEGNVKYHQWSQGGVFGHSSEVMFLISP